MERRLVHRFEHLMDGLLDPTIDHVGDPQATLPLAACLRDPHPLDLARLIRPRQQTPAQFRQNRRQALSHLADGLPIGIRCPLIRRDLGERLMEPFDPLFLSSRDLLLSA